MSFVGSRCVSGTLAPTKKQKPARVNRESSSKGTPSTATGGSKKPQKSGQRSAPKKSKKSEDKGTRREQQQQRAKNEHRKQAGRVESAFDDVFGEDATAESPAATSPASQSAQTANADSGSGKATTSQPATGVSEPRPAPPPSNPAPPQAARRPPYRPPAFTPPKRSSRGGSWFDDLFADREQLNKAIGIIAGCAAVYFAYTFLFSGVPSASDVETSLSSFIEEYDQLTASGNIAENDWINFGNKVREEIYPFLEAYQSASGSKNDRDIQMYEAAVLMIDLVNCDPKDQKRQTRISGEFRNVLSGNSEG